jgi:hypothetical protein
MFDNMPFLSVPKKATVVDELTRYLASPTEATVDPLLWWIEKRAVYPRLARMALNYLSIPGQFYLALLLPFFNVILFISATSTDVERVFSKGRLVLSHVRNRLSVESTRAVLCLGAWSKLGFVNNGDIKEATILPEAKDGDPDVVL